MTMNVLMAAVPSTKTRKPQSGDMVFEVEVPFALEIILADKKISLPERAGRSTVDVQINDRMHPIVIVEAYAIENNTLQLDRFIRSYPVKFGK